MHRTVRDCALAPPVIAPPLLRAGDLEAFLRDHALSHVAIVSDSIPVGVVSREILQSTPPDTPVEALLAPGVLLFPASLSLDAAARYIFCDTRSAGLVLDGDEILGILTEDALLAALEAPEGTLRRHA